MYPRFHKHIQAAAISAAFLFIASSVAFTAESEQLRPAPGFSIITREFAAAFPRQHLKYSQLDDTVSAMTWTNYINTLDPDHSYFLASDIEEFAKSRNILDDMLVKGDTDFAYQAFNKYKERLADRYNYIEELLSGDFDLNIKETYTVRRRQEPFAGDRKEWDDLWRRKVKNDYIRYFIADEISESDKDDPDAEDKDEEDEDEELDPHEAILKRYRNMKTIIDDSDAEWVLEKYLSAVAQAYDPHSSYLSPSALANFNIEMKLSLEGIGALLQPQDGAAMIVRLIPGGPADRDKSDSRLMPKDKIIAVGQGDEEPVDVLHWPLDKIVKLIRGPKGTDVVLVIIPKSDPSSTRKVRITRDEVKLEDQAAKWNTVTTTDSSGKEYKLGVISLRAFYANMYSRRRSDPDYRSSSYDIEKLIQEHADEDIDGILLDIRHNGGGALIEAINMTGLFIDSGPVVQVKERFRRVLHDDDPRTVYAGPLAVLVNRLSASASEILVSALQDYGRAVIIGDSKTHGKGTVQTILGLDEKNTLGAIKVTSAGYYRISGDSTQLVGVEPDIILPSMFDHSEWGEENLPNAIMLPPVHRANYSQVSYMEPVIAKLTQNSKARLKDDPKYNGYVQLMEKIMGMYDRKEMPLDLATRRNMAREEKELSDIQEELMQDVNSLSTTNDTMKSDIILQESLNILADLAASGQLASQPIPEEARQPPPTLLERINNWIRKL